jgi:glycolate oxidase FAD binding subunit
MTGAGLKGAVRWDVHLPPRAAPALIAALPSGAEWAMDWGGGRVWVCCDGEDDAVRQLAAGLGGEARLIAAPEVMRAQVPAFQPRAKGVAALEARVRQAFDPSGVFAAGRFAEDGNADALPA